MLLPSLVVDVVADNAIGVARVLGSTVVCWSWFSAFRLMREPEPREPINPGVWISGFGRF